jgi:hypothetical protein
VINIKNFNFLTLLKFFRLGVKSEKEDNQIHVSDKLSQNPFNIKKTNSGIERRAYTRNIVNNGPLYVYWINKEGLKCQGKVINISINSILFSTGDIFFDSDTIDELEYPPLSVSLKVEKASIIPRRNRMAVAIIEEFENNLEDQKRWLEVLVRCE